jgi:hypothetical protein
VSTSRELARQLGVGRLLYRVLHRPRQKLALAREYGPALVWRAASGERDMRQAARSLPAPPDGGRPPIRVPVCLLSGSRFVHQTIFCLHSLATQAGPITAPIVLSDGTLTNDGAASIRRLWPTATVRHSAELDALVAAALPASRFPVLHAIRREFILIRKLTDSMAGRVGYHLLLDSDMLFWRRPTELLQRLRANDPVYLSDVSVEGYTAPRAELERRFRISVAPAVNSGLVGVNASLIDWDLIERACDFLRHSSGDRRLLEQTLWAVVLGAVGANSLDPTDYAVSIDPRTCLRLRCATPQPALLHYAWHARLSYTAGEWRRYAASTLIPS